MRQLLKVPLLRGLDAPAARVQAPCRSDKKDFKAENPQGRINTLPEAAIATPGNVAVSCVAVDEMGYDGEAGAVADGERLQRNEASFLRHGQEQGSLPYMTSPRAVIEDAFKSLESGRRACLSADFGSGVHTTVVFGDAGGREVDGVGGDDAQKRMLGKLIAIAELQQAALKVQPLMSLPLSLPSKLTP